jgi:Mn-dependent DtxR family transcriptional regulator
VIPSLWVFAAEDSAMMGERMAMQARLFYEFRLEEYVPAGHMQAITTIGLDIAKSVFQVHGIDVEGNVIIRRQLKRHYVLTFFQKLPPCLVGIEACASSHHWSRELAHRFRHVIAVCLGNRITPPHD